MLLGMASAISWLLALARTEQHTAGCRAVAASQARGKLLLSYPRGLGGLVARALSLSPSPGDTCLDSFTSPSLLLFRSQDDDHRKRRRRCPPVRAFSVSRADRGSSSHADADGEEDVEFIYTSVSTFH